VVATKVVKFYFIQSKVRKQRLAKNLIGQGVGLARVPNLAREHFYPVRERGLGNEILLPSNEKVNNLQVAV